MMQQLLETFTEHIQQLSVPHPEEMDEALDAVISAMPTFVYYANYGNLDSEIYLPHVVENLERDDLGAKEVAKARTLRVLFSFVQLQAKEILELGRDFQDPDNPNREPNDEELDKIKEGKRTRSILLQSAGAKLTKGFKEWFKQGDYRFRFEADGNHFRIWVADDRRPTEVELESRSTGLQWFLSFYLVFLVESSGEHKKAVLLLDEPGLSLHPLAEPVNDFETPDDCDLLSSFSCCGSHGWIDPDRFGQGVWFWDASNEAFGMTGPSGLKGPPALVQHALGSMVMDVARG